MGTKNLLMLKTHFDSINTRFINEFLYGSMLWVIGSLRIFICKYVLYSFGLILRYILRFQVGDRKNELVVQHPETDQTETFPDSEVDAFREAETNLQFQSREDDEANSNKREGETESSVFMDSNSDVHEDGEFREGETEGSALMESDSDVDDVSKEVEEAEGSVFMRTDSNCHHQIKDRGFETEDCGIKEADSNVNEDTKKKEESSVSMESHCNVLEYSTNREENEEEEPESSISMENHCAATTSKCLYVSNKDFCGFIEEPTTMSFTFQEFYVGPNVFTTSNNAFDIAEMIADKQFPESNLEEDPLDGQAEKESLPSLPDNAFSKSVLVADKQFSESNSEEFSADQEEEKESVSNEIVLGNESFRRNYSSASDEDEENMLYNDPSSAYDSESESSSSSSSGLIWGNSKKIEDSIMSKFLAFDKAFEGFEPESPVKIRNEKVEDDEYIELEPSMKDWNSWGQEEEDNLKKIEESRWEENLSEPDSDEESEDDLEWEHDDLVEQLKTELRNARQGGLPTILEEEEEEEETQSPKVIEDLKPLKLEDKLEYKDQINEIQKVYKNYAEKMRKLDILNYQTMHSIGLLQVKDPLKLISTPKWSVPISQNLWPRKASKIACDPLMKSVHELHRQLELVYVGQVCLSWEILCWQHRKTQELKQYDPQETRQYNLVAGEFQLFQVLMNRFLENETFQGPRVQNYVKNRCVIRNLLQIPAIKDDYTKDRNLTKGNEEDHAIGCVRLADIIKESMGVFREFVRADKDDGNAMLKTSHQSGIDPKDPESLNLLMDIRTNLQKKEKRLKDLVRSGNCLVKKFQKQREDQLNHEQLLAQVELKLIWRVINMSKLRKDQLIWCREKLSRIKFVNRKTHVEPAFALFPC
ncbi:hypothetical protein L6164_020793 [Bauhinia variegata]|uniref:Uncharacterized protein n=1 Tax=Bauhinia variegata TaxID=167791 RepID=A0ACB9MW50_BAUVA|nr:hypothetical protein L6164_020793 [Bauhinia variegata]